MEINEGIRDREVRVIDADGSQLGIMSTRDALAKAEEKNLDLVKIAPQAQPPVCKFLDYGKYRFEMQKRDKEAKKNQKIVDIKEIRLSLNIELLHKLKDKKAHVGGRCAKCRFLNICGGNFRARAEAYYGDEWAQDPACYLTDEEIGL